jgi:hypothetical protein
VPVQPFSDNVLMPIDRGAIDMQLQALGESQRWWDQRELRDLPAILQADERILAISRGKIARLRWLRRLWLIVATDKRLLCVRSARKSSWRQLEVNGNLIARVTLRIGPFRGSVVVTAGGHTYRVLTPRTDAYKLATALSTLGPAKKEAVPGFRATLVVRRVIDHVLALPAFALNPYPQASPTPNASGNAALDDHVRTLEGQLQELQQQVDFLEQLLHQQHALPKHGQKVIPD